MQDIHKTAGLASFNSHEYQTYVIDWQPGRVSWYVNGVKIRELTQALPTTPMQLHLDSHHSDQWDAFVETKFAGAGAAKVDSVRYEPYNYTLMRSAGQSIRP